MTAMATGWCLPPVVSVVELGPPAAALSQGDGESLGIYRLSARPGWLAKIYKSPQEAEHAANLDQLIALPRDAPASDRDVLWRHTSWPVARVTDGLGRGVGCVLPEAPATYRAKLGEEERFLEVDLLAKPAEAFPRRGLVAPSYEERVKVCASIASVAAVLERNALIYSDWSYSNAFWSPTEYTAYVIDMDGCRRYANHNICQPNWDDPLTPRSTPADAYTDRYRVGLLVARCLTGQRDRTEVLHCLAGSDTEVAELLLDVLLAADRTRRPTASALSTTLIGMPYLRIPILRDPLPDRPAAARPKPSRQAGQTAPTTRIPAAEATTRQRRRPWLRPLAAWILAITIALVGLTILIMSGSHWTAG